jgi:hypothetical protein
LERRWLKPRPNRQTRPHRPLRPRPRSIANITRRARPPHRRTRPPPPPLRSRWETQGTEAVFHETAPTVNENLPDMLLPSPTQASIRILIGPILEGPMQVKFRVEAWRCHLSHELEAHCPRRSRQKIRVVHNTSLTTKTSPHLRKGLETLPSRPHPVQQHGQFSGHRDHRAFLGRTAVAFR